MLIALILVSVALAVTLGLLIFGSKDSLAATPSASAQVEAETKARQKAEAELEKKRKEYEEQKALLADAKDQLKQAKKKLFDQSQDEKGGHDLQKARAEVERQASIQLEIVRGELAASQAEVTKLRAELSPGKRRPAPEPAPEAHAAPPAAEPKREEPPRKYRDLNDADREKMERFEHEAKKERARAADLDREVKRLKGQVETQRRVYLVTKGELDLIKDKFKALEKRLNRTLLESDLLRRAIKDVEKKSGVTAERTELTADEIAASDKKVEDQAKADAARVAAETREAQQTPETPPAPAAEPPAAEAASAPPAPAPEPEQPADPTARA